MQMYYLPGGSFNTGGRLVPLRASETDPNYLGYDACDVRAPSGPDRWLCSHSTGLGSSPVFVTDP